MLFVGLSANIVIDGPRLARKQISSKTFKMQLQIQSFHTQSQCVLHVTSRNPQDRHPVRRAAFPGMVVQLGSVPTIDKSWKLLGYHGYLRFATKLYKTKYVPEVDEQFVSTRVPHPISSKASFFCFVLTFDMSHVSSMLMRSARSNRGTWRLNGNLWAATF